MLIVGDLHAKRNFIYDEKHYTKDRFLRCIDYTFQQILKYSQKLNDNIIIFTGDIIETSEKIDSLTFNTLTRCFERLKKYKKKVIVLCGNHDKIVIRGYEFTPIEFLTYLEVTVVDSPKTINNIPDTFFIPYGYDPFQKHNNKIVITHLANKLSSPFDKEAINPANIHGKLIINGHIHKPSEFKLKGKKLFINIGVPFPTRKGEEEWKNRIIHYNNNILRELPLYIHKIVYKKINIIDELNTLKTNDKYKIKTLYLTIPQDFKYDNKYIKSRLNQFDTVYIFREKETIVKYNPDKKTKKATKTGLLRRIITDIKSDWIDKKFLFKSGVAVIKEASEEYGESLDNM